MIGKNVTKIGVFFFLVCLTAFPVLANKESVEKQLEQDFAKAKKTVCQGNIRINNDILAVTFTVYDPPIALKYVYDKLADVSRSTPEQLMLSLNSEDSKRWGASDSLENTAPFISYETTNQTFQFEEDWYGRKIRKKNPKQNHMLISSRFDFTYKDVPYCFIKYWESDDHEYYFPRVRAACLSNTEWKFDEDVGELESLRSFHQKIRAAYIMDLITGKYMSQNESFKNYYQRWIYYKNNFSCGLFLAEYLKYVEKQSPIEDMYSRNSSSELQKKSAKSYQQWSLEKDKNDAEVVSTLYPSNQVPALPMNKKTVETKLKQEFNAPWKEEYKTNVRLASGQILPLVLTAYDPPLRLKYVYQSLSDVSWTTPEQLMLSINSEDSEEWWASNYFDSVKYELPPMQLQGGRLLFTEPPRWFENFINKQEWKKYPQMYHMVISSRIDFVYEGTSYCMFKYWDSSREGRWPYYRIACLRQKLWKCITIPNDSPLIAIYNLHNHFRTAYLIQMLTGGFTSPYPELNEAYQRSFTENSLDVGTFRNAYTDFISNQDLMQLQDLQSINSDDEYLIETGGTSNK
ncbi:MAG TPA: hypothetical protein VHY08_21945 [Bacillota bacterium]|nr:hypothetical protein [Bacillota bacterium]